MDGPRARAGGTWRGVALRFRHPLVQSDRAERLRGFRWAFRAPGPDDEAALATGPYARDPDLARLEAVLLVAQEPLSSRRLAQLASLADGTKACTLVRALNQRYDREGSAFRVEEVAGGLQLLSRPQFAPWLRRLQPRPVEVRLSAPAMETLAVVAYRQPVLRADVEAIRGVQCGEILRQLIERELVRISGRSEDLGRPLMYATTKRFLQVFGLRSLDELPRAELPQAGREPVETSPGPTPDTDTSQPTPTAFGPTETVEAIEEKEVSRLIPTPGAEEDLATVVAQVAVPPSADVAGSELDQFDDEDDDFDDEDEDDYDHFDDEDDDEDDDYDDEDYDEEEEDEEEEDEEEPDDFEDEEWEEVEDEDEEEEDEDYDEDEDDWDDDEDWDDDDWDEDDEDEDDEDEEDEEEDD